MFRLNAFVAAPAMFVLLSGTAHAALTADQVWKSWQDAGAGIGLAVAAATEANSGGVLTLNGVTLTPQGAPAGFTISDMTLTEEADGSVTIRPGATMGFAASEGTNSAKLDVTHDALAIVAREDAGGMVYDYSAAKLDVTFDMSAEGASAGTDAPAQPNKASGHIGLEALSGSYSDTPGANRTFGLAVKAAKLISDMNADDPAMAISNTSHSEVADVDVGLNVTLPSTTPLAAIATPADFQKVLEEGFAVAATFSQGASTGTASQKNEFFPYEMTVATGGGEGNFAFNKDKVELVSKGTGIDMKMTSAALPVPASATMADMAVTLLLPVVAPTAPADAALKLKLGQLTLSDEVWGLFDPGAALKREPFDLNIDVSGRTTLDLIAIASAEETGVEPPVPAPEKLDITDISLKVAGAALNAVGAFTFDNSMGMPMPLGEATVNITGANALIDGLIATGLLPEDQAMSARMMMGMFMTPTGDDALTSKIEAKEGFAIFVNGQQIQ